MFNDIFIPILVTLAADIISHYVIKWLDKDN